MATVELGAVTAGPGEVTVEVGAITAGSVAAATVEVGAITAGSSPAPVVDSPWYVVLGDDLALVPVALTIPD